MFDRSFLPKAQFEFVVVADTHYMIDPGNQSVEFESRRLQTARAEHALRQIAALDVPLVIHMGDLVQEFPERPNFARAVDEAQSQLRRCGIQPHFVAGNHDIGDKPDPTMPASWVTSEFLANYHERFGPSWYSWDEGDLHFIVLNSQIMNSALPEADEQKLWFESDLHQHQGRRIFLFLHLPPFLMDEHEPALGHYDNIDEPARSWLLALVRQHRVELLFAAHVHWSFVNQIDETRYFTVPSVAFTRPGFSELFSSTPPAEQGRNDVGKLGFFLVRVYERETRVHFIRTSGETEIRDVAANTQRLITRTSPGLPTSRLGLVLHHPLVNTVEVPSIWPSTIRQPVRNDYPLLSCLELGVRYLRLPSSDLIEPLQRKRLALLRAQGVHLTATWLWHDQLDLSSEVVAIRGRVDGTEVQLLGSPWPSLDCLHQLRECATQHDVSIDLSTVIPGQYVTGKQHARVQRGYRLDELSALEQHLTQHDAYVDRVLCRIDPQVGPWQMLSEAKELLSFDHIGAVDWIFELDSHDERMQCNQVAEALFAVAALADSRLYLEPLMDLDRTMDVGHGLLDRMCNPRVAFHVARHLNTLLFHRNAKLSMLQDELVVAHGTCMGLTDGIDVYWLILPMEKTVATVLDITQLNRGQRVQVDCYDLVTGASYLLSLTGDGTLKTDKPVLVVVKG